MKFIEVSELEFKKHSGKEKLRCPKCSDTRTDKKDKSLLYNHDEGRGKCFYCESLVFNTSKSEKRNIKPYKELLPSNHTNISPNLLKWLESRSISEKTAKDLFITEEVYYQPQKGKEVNNIVFNYYEEHRLVNKKFRSGDKKFTQVSGAKPIFYNINATIGQKEVIIVEGEMDVLALYECGVRNVISVPNGANNSDEYWVNSESFLKNIDSFIIAVDNDEKGNNLKDAIVQRLGKYRCKYIDWSCKDANEVLIQKGKEQVLEEIKNANYFPVVGVLTTNDLRDEIISLYRDGLPKTIKPIQKRWQEVNKIFSVMLGQLTVVTGIPSHGKSSVIDDYVISLVNDLGLKASWFSPEHNPKGIHQSTFARKVTGKAFWGENRMSEMELEKYINWASEKLYITSQDEEIPTWDWLFDRMKEQILIYGINIFVIDAFNKVIMNKGDKTEIDTVLTKLTSFCIRHNVLVFLIVHPTKMRKNEKTGKYEMPNLYDCSGSSDFRNQTHNGITIYREFEDENTTAKTLFVNTKTKFEFQGVINSSAELKYCNTNGRFYSYNEEPNYTYIDYETQPLIDYDTGDVKEINHFEQINNFENEFSQKDEAPF